MLRAQQASNFLSKLKANYFNISFQIHISSVSCTI